MCIAYPGIVIEVKERTAVVDFSGTRVEAMTGIKSVEKGDRVLVHAGCVLEILKDEDADEIEEIFRELEELRMQDLREGVRG